MMKETRRWPVISALGIVQIFAWGSSYYLLAVLAAPIVADTGWPLPWVVGAITAGLVCAGMVSPLIGRTIGVDAVTAPRRPLCAKVGLQ